MNRTRIRIDQLVRVFFISKVMLSGIDHITSLQSEGEALSPRSGRPILPERAAGPGAAAFTFKPIHNQHS